MKRLPIGLIRFVQYAAAVLLAVALFAAVTLLAGARPVYALPEYAERTGEACAACHVSPGGGGPRTLRGLLWAARGRPDSVPPLPGVLIAPGVSDGSELYDIACAACHGSKGEGLFAIGLTGTQISKPAIRSFVVQGIPLSGMPGFKGQFTAAQLDALVTFVAALADGSISPLPDSYLLPPAHFKCRPIAPAVKCGGN
ncbi:MAG: cytochrome c [Chloroflexi bacterium]|nr:cytochrome c [Chloroflexota bacterium]